jgi:hypothetical protein
MKKMHLLLTMLTTLFLLGSCKKDSTPLPTLTFTNNLVEGTASNNGEYTITGRISSTVRLEKVVLTKEGQATPFLTDDSTAKNKNEYDFSYLVTGITANTYIVIDVYDQSGGKITLRFLVKK